MEAILCKAAQLALFAFQVKSLIPESYSLNKYTMESYVERVLFTCYTGRFTSRQYFKYDFAQTG